MTARIIRFASLIACVMAIVVPAQAQLGHPAKGTWIGHWGPDAKNEQRMVILLDWGNQKLTGELNPGPDATKLSDAEIDYDTWTMTLKADLPENGKKQNWVATGKLENLGSWTNRRYEGTYQYGNEKGNFSFTLQ